MRVARWAVLVLLVAVEVAAQPYVFRRGDRTRATTTDAIDEVQSLLDAKGDFFWIRRDGREYIVRDARTLAEIDEAFAPMRALGDEKRTVKERVRPLRQEARSLERRLQREDDPAARARLDEVYRELRVAEEEQERVMERRRRAGREADAKVNAIFERALRSGLAVAR